MSICNSFRFAGAKVLTFFEPTKYLGDFFRKKFLTTEDSNLAL